MSVKVTSNPSPIHQSEEICCPEYHCYIGCWYSRTALLAKNIDYLHYKGQLTYGVMALEQISQKELPKGKEISWSKASRQCWKKNRLGKCKWHPNVAILFSGQLFQHRLVRYKIILLFKLDFKSWFITKWFFLTLISLMDLNIADSAPFREYCFQYILYLCPGFDRKSSY